MSHPAPSSAVRIGVVLGLLLGLLVVPGAAGAATHSAAGGDLTLDLEAGEQVTAVATGAGYDLTLDSGTWTGGAPGVTGTGTSTITVPADSYATLVFTDSGAGAGLTFADSGANTWSDAVTVTFDDGGTVDVASPLVLGAGNGLDLSADAGIGLGADVTTGGAQEYRADVTLTADVVLTSTAAGDVTFHDGTNLDGAHGLTVNTAGATSFDGEVGQVARPTGVTTDAAGTTEMSSPDADLDGDWVFNDPVVGQGGIRVEGLGGGSVTFSQTMTGGDWILVVDDTLTFADTAVPDGLQVLNLGTTVVEGNLVQTTLYGMVIGNDVTLDSPAGTTTFQSAGDLRLGYNAAPVVGGAVDGVESLVLEAADQVILHSEVGANPGRLDDLTINDTVEFTSNATRQSDGYIEVAGTLSLAPDDVAEAAMATATVNDAPIVLSATEIELGGPVSGTDELTLTTSVADGPIRLGGAADSGAGTLDLTDTELAQLADGFTSLTVGSPTAGEVTVESVALTDPLTLVSGGIIADADDAGTDLTVPAVALEGTVAPGSSVGIFAVSGDVTLDGAVAVEFTDGTTADQLAVTGAVTILVGTTLATSGLTTGSVDGDVVTLVDNDGADAVTGTFDGLAEGATVTVDGRGFVLSYAGGDGNDVVLVRDGTPPSVVAGVAGTLGDNGWFVDDATVTWTVTDDQTVVGSTTGCGPTVVDTDTVGQDVTCEATSGGGTTSVTETVRRDTTAPVVQVTGVVAGASYRRGSVPTAGCDTTDATSGVAVAATPTTTGGGSAGTGTFTVTCDGATDTAGNTGMAAVSYVVREPNPPATLTPTDPAAPPVVPDRVGGQTRVETAVLAAQQAYPEPASAGGVVLVRADGFADAQAGVPLAVDRSAAVLATQGDALHPAVAEEIGRVLEPGGTVWLLGGEAALSDAVSAAAEEAVAGLGGQVVRLAGANRFATAVAIAEALGDPAAVVLADGGSFTDSIVASAAAVVAEGTSFAGADAGSAGSAGSVGALLLTAGEVMPPETRAYLDGLGGAGSDGVAGGASVVTIGAAAGVALPDAPTVAASDPAAQSVAVAEAFFPGPTAVGIATTADFADALAGAATVTSPSVGPGPVLLSGPDALPEVVAEHLAAIRGTVTRALLFGGESALSSAVRTAVEAALAG